MVYTFIYICTCDPNPQRNPIKSLGLLNANSSEWCCEWWSCYSNVTQDHFLERKSILCNTTTCAIYLSSLSSPVLACSVSTAIKVWYYSTACKVVHITNQHTNELTSCGLKAYFHPYYSWIKNIFPAVLSPPPDTSSLWLLMHPQCSYEPLTTFELFSV